MVNRCSNPVPCAGLTEQVGGSIAAGPESGLRLAHDKNAEIETMTKQPIRTGDLML